MIIIIIIIIIILTWEGMRGLIQAVVFRRGVQDTPGQEVRVNIHILVHGSYPVWWEVVVVSVVVVVVVVIGDHGDDSKWRY